MVLHRDELRPAVFLGQRIHLRHLIGVGVGDANIARDVQIDIVHAEVLQAAVDVVQHMLTAIDAVCDFLLRARQELRGHHHVLAPCHVLQRPAHELLRRAQLIGNGRVEEVHAEVE